MINFSLPNVDDREISLADYQSQQGLILIFTCNHCPYAIAYEERLNELYQKYNPLGVALVAISSNDVQQYPQDSPENMKIRAHDKGFQFPYLFDESQEVAKSFEAERTPHAYFLIPSGDQWKILYKGAIDNNYRNPQAVTEKYLENAVDQYLSQGNTHFWETAAIGCTIKWKLK